MTAEERMAYFQGEKRRNSPSVESTKGASSDLLYLKIKFFIAVILFVLFLSLDYTGYEIQGIGSERIIKEVTKDISFETLKERYSL